MKLIIGVKFVLGLVTSEVVDIVNPLMRVMDVCNVANMSNPNWDARGVAGKRNGISGEKICVARNTIVGSA